MKKGIFLAVVGAAMIIAGLFLPIVRFPGGGEATYFNGGDLYGALTMAIAIFAGIMGIVKMRSMVFLSGLASIGVVIARLITVIRDLPDENSLRTQFKELIQSNVPGSSGEEIANIIGGPQLHWLGWTVLLAGGVVVLFAAFISSKE
ncbi:hypothetical protein [Mesotoga prima]|uniref:hypothetical protein n=1 Tax=Mesotoga prima TaxID=1184387 RepID=UPI002B61D858|nr:hypothetical protein [Mesotoga prima]HQC14510.1 hypothetical protein [Mesotoga prima]